MVSRKCKIITLVVLMITMMCSVILVVGAADDTSEPYYRVMRVENISEFRKQDLDNPEKLPKYEEEGYIFAGWFNEQTCETAISTQKMEGEAWAKFVPAEILGLKAQVSKELTDEDTNNDESGSIRFLTSVDTLNYSKIGFKIVRDIGDRKTEDRASGTVYETVNVTDIDVGEETVTSYTASKVFHEKSRYFKAWTYTGVPEDAYNVNITVTPYWVTLDGTTVKAPIENELKVKCVNMGRQWKYIFVKGSESDDGNGEGTGTRGCPYTTLNGALDHAEKYGKDGGSTNVIVLKDITVNSVMTVSKNITLTSEDAVTITRGVGVTGNLFTVSEGTTFEIKGTEENPITIDGAKKQDSSNVRAVIVNESANCNLDYATIQNFSTDEGGAIKCLGRVKATESTFRWNDATTNRGGAILIYNQGEVESENCTFQENTAVGHGGAINCASGTSFKDTNSSFIKNSGKKGGAVIAMSSAKATLTGTNENTKFSGNVATDTTGEGSAIFVQGTVSITGYAFEGEQTIHMTGGTLNFDDITGATLVQGSGGKLNVVGYEDNNDLTVTPYKYEEDYQVLTKADGMTEEDFEAACAGIKVTPDAEGKAWHIEENDDSGVLKKAEARIGDTYYPTLEEAIEKADANAPQNIVISGKIELSKAMTISKNITLVSDGTVTITRGAGVTGNLFTVSGGMTFTIKGTQENPITIEGAKNQDSSNARAIIVNESAICNLDYVTIQNFTTTRGGAILCSGRVKATNSTFKLNDATDTSTGQGGAIYIEKTGKVESENCNFEWNTSVGHGGAIYCAASGAILEDTNSSFIRNSGKKGGAVIAMSGATATLTGTNGNAKFVGNVATDSTGQGSALFAQGTISVYGYNFEGCTDKTIYVTGTLNYGGLTGITDAQIVNSGGNKNKEY